MGDWTARLAALLTDTASPVIVVAGEEWGLSAVLDRLRERGRFGWIQGSPRFTNDAVAQGNALATALNEATGTRLFSSGLTPELHIERFRRYFRELAPATLMVTGAEFTPELSPLQSALTVPGLHLIWEFSANQLPRGANAVPLADFRLSRTEALSLAPEDIPVEAVLSELERAGGFAPAFINRLNLLAERTASEKTPGTGQAGEYHSPELVIAALLRRKRYEDALELAIQAAPRLVDRVVDRAGPEFQRNGRLARLHLLLSSLDEPWSNLEATLEWRLVAAVEVNDHAALLPEVDEFLAVNPAANLRARRAALLSPARRRTMANEALALARTPLTVWQAGRSNPDPDSAITLLQESVQLAEDAGSPYEIARNAGSLTQAYHHAGQFGQAVHWGMWALSVLDEAGIGDGTRRARIANLVVISGMLIGDTLGLQERLEEAIHLNLAAAPDAVANMKLTLATLAVAEDNPGRAYDLLQEASVSASRRLLAGTVQERVHVLLAVGRFSEAARAAEQALAFSSGEMAMVSDNALLASNMLRALDGDSDALAPLLTLAGASYLPIVTRLAAWLYAQLLPGVPAEAPAGLGKPLSELALSGLRALSAPAERFEPIWRNLLGDSAELQIRVMGEPAVRLNGQEVRLTNRMWEVLTVIALHPGGISDEQLLDFLIRDGQGFGISALRTHVSRLRAEIPVSDTPYRLLVSNQLDVLELRRALSRGELRKAMTLMAGPLLPASRSAGIEELRHDLEAELTEAALASADVEVVYALAERFVDDFRLWERSAELLPVTDGRYAVAQARLKRISADYLN